MKVKISYLVAFILLALFLVSCQPQPEVDTIAADSTEETDGMQETEIAGERVTYGDGFSGYLVKPIQEGPSPGVVMIHEWWGLNQNIMDMAEDLSEEGYTVLAVDLYDGKVADNADNARSYAASVRENPERAIEHMKSAVAFLKEQNAYRVASMGWCFGGGMSMQLALNEELDATVIYYGNLIMDEEQLKSINWPVLGIFGEEDTSITVESVNQFDMALDNLGIDNEIYVYEDVGHAFANPSNPGHDAKKTEDAWMKTVDFLDKNLK